MPLRPGHSEGQEEVSQVPRDGMDSGMPGLQRERIQRDQKGMVQEMRDDWMRRTIESQRQYRTSVFTGYIVFANSGIVAGLAVAGMLYRFLSAAKAAGITSIIEIALTLVSFALLSIGAFRLRGWRSQLCHEREEILAKMRSDIDECFSDDPVTAARIKMDLEERWPKP